MASRPPSPRAKSCGRLIGLALEVPPAAYIAITGQAPTWVRVWLATWLSLWLLFTVAAASNQQTS